MRKIVFVLMGTVVLLFVVTMCISGRVKDARSDEEQNISAADYDVETDTVMDDSIVQLLMVAMPDSVAQQLLVRKAYVTSYNKETLLPNWVAWRLTGEHTDGAWKRLDDYHEDFDVPAPRAVPEDYWGVGEMGLSRGHMCPAGDNKWSRRAIYESNALTNICPQNRSMNSGVWNSIENDCRRWAEQYGEVYVVCGPLLLRGEHQRIGEHGVVVPEAFFKVVLCLTEKPWAFGIIVRNNDVTRKRDLYYNTIDQVERVTGYDFFSALPDSLEDAVERELNKP